MNTSQLNNYFDILCDSRLLYNSREEFGEAIGFSLSKNGLGRVSENRKAELFRNFDVKLKEKFFDNTFELAPTMRSYVNASAFFNDFKRRKVGKLIAQDAAVRNDFAKALLTFHSNGEKGSNPDFVKELVKLNSDSSVNRVFFMLMVLGVLPPIGNRADITKEQIDADREAVEAFFTENGAHVAWAETLKQKFAIDSRMALCFYTSCFMQSSLMKANPDVCFDRNRMIDYVRPANIDGLWCEGEPNEYRPFWKIMMNADASFFFDRYTPKFNGKNVSFTYERFETYFCREDNSDEIAYSMASPDAVIHRVIEGCLRSGDLTTGTCSFTDDSITTKVYVRGPIGPLSLHRMSQADTNKFTVLIDGATSVESSTVPIELRISLILISCNYLYLQDYYDGTIYKVPKSLNKAFPMVDFNSSMSIARIGDRKFIALADAQTYVEITTPQQCKEAGIEVITNLGEVEL